MESFACQKMITLKNEQKHNCDCATSIKFPFIVSLKPKRIFHLLFITAHKVQIWKTGGIITGHVISLLQQRRRG